MPHPNGNPDIGSSQIEMNNDKRNQLSAEDVGSFMLFRGKFYGCKKEIYTLNNADHIAQLPCDNSRGKRSFGVVDKLRQRRSCSVP